MVLVVCNLVCCVERCLSSLGEVHFLNTKTRRFSSLLESFRTIQPGACSSLGANVFSPCARTYCWCAPPKKPPSILIYSHISTGTAFSSNFPPTNGLIYLSICCSRHTRHAAIATHLSPSSKLPISAQNIHNIFIKTFKTIIFVKI